MAKEYLSKYERARFIYMLFFEDFMKNDLLADTKNTYFSKEELANFRKAKTFMNKANVSIAKRVDNESIRAILNAVKVNALELLPRPQMEAKLKTILTDKKHVEVLTEHALNTCYSCDGRKKECDLRNTLKILNTEIVGNEDKEICEYKFINTQEAV